MEEEISLREIIEVILEGKWIIASITAIAIVISGIFSFFMVEPVYEAKASLMVNSLSQGNGSLDTYLNEMVSPAIYEKQLNSPGLLSIVREKEGLEDTTISSLQSRLTIESNLETKVINLKMEGTDRDKILSFMNTLVTESKHYTAAEIKQKLEALMTEYQTNMKEEQQNLNAAIEEYNKLKAGAGLPALILFQQNSGSSQYVLQANQALLDELRSLDKEKQVEYEKINTKVNKLTNLYNDYYEKYEEARSVNPQSFIDTRVTVLEEAFVPVNPVGNNALLNIAIATVVGLMLSVFIVFIRSYWRNSATTEKKENTASN